MSKVKLFCFSYAGGSAESIYRKWAHYFNPLIEIIPVELAGRGRRLEDPFYDSLDEAVEDIYTIIKDQTKQPFAFFGHSLGSYIAYDLSHRIVQDHNDNLIHLFVSGRNPPHIQRENKILHLLPDEDFKKELINLGGIPEELIKDDRTFNFFIPIIRADFKMAETYIYEEKNQVLTCPITVINGVSDERIKQTKIHEWARHTMNSCDFYNFQGGHFYLHENISEITRVIASKIE